MVVVDLGVVILLIVCDMVPIFAFLVKPHVRHRARAIRRSLAISHFTNKFPIIRAVSVDKVAHGNLLVGRHLSLAAVVGGPLPGASCFPRGFISRGAVGPFGAGGFGGDEQRYRSKHDEKTPDHCLSFHTESLAYLSRQDKQ
jgi:hypothetical protein